MNFSSRTLARTPASGARLVRKCAHSRSNVRYGRQMAVTRQVRRVVLIFGIAAECLHGVLLADGAGIGACALTRVNILMNCTGWASGIWSRAARGAGPYGLACPASHVCRGRVHGLCADRGSRCGGDFEGARCVRCTSSFSCVGLRLREGVGRVGGFVG